MKCALAFVLCASLVASVLSLPMDAADQQAEPALVVYRSVVPSTVNIGRVPLVHFIRKREVDSSEMDQQADESALVLLRSSAVMPTTLGLRHLGLVNSPFFIRKKRDVDQNEMDQQADPNLLVYRTLPVMSGIHSPFIWRKKRDTADQTAEEARILYTMPLVNNIWGRRTIMMPFLKK